MNYEVLWKKWTYLNEIVKLCHRELRIIFWRKIDWRCGFWNCGG